jgi:hypothetical protein
VDLGFIELAVVVRVELGQRFLLQGIDGRAASLAREGAVGRLSLFGIQAAVVIGVELLEHHRAELVLRGLQPVGAAA